MNKYYARFIESGDKNFVNFVKINSDHLTDDDLVDLEFLARRIAQNMYVYPENIETAKSDYVALIGLLIRKGAIFEKYKEFKASPDGYD